MSSIQQPLPFCTEYYGWFDSDGKIGSTLPPGSLPKQIPNEICSCTNSLEILRAYYALEPSATLQYTMNIRTGKFRDYRVDDGLEFDTVEELREYILANPM